MDVAVYGGGGFAREVAWLIEDIAAEGVDLRMACFIDDDENKQGTVINGYPVVSLEEAAGHYQEASVAYGIGDPSVRERIAGSAESKGFKCVTLIHPRIEKSRFLEVGEGTIICAGNILTVNIVIMRHVHINLDCTIGHDVVFDDFSTLAPGVHVSGWVHFGKRVYVGTGAVIINGTDESPLTIGDDAVIGAGACVVKSVPPATTVVGIPAKPIVRNIKKR